MSCEQCVPSVTDPEKFKCYTPVQQGFIITGYVVSALSSLFSLYKLRILVQERVQKLKDAGIRPSLNRIVFLERTLASQSKLMLVPMTDIAEQPGAADEGRSDGDDGAVQMVRDVERRLQGHLQQQQQHHEQLKQQQNHHEQQQQQLQELLKQQQQQMTLLQQQMQQLTQRLQK